MSLLRPSPKGKDKVLGSIYARESRRHRAEGCYHDLDDLCSTRDTMASGISEQLHDGWIHPYFAGHRNHRAGSRPHSGATIRINDLLIRTCTVSSINVAI